MRRAAMRFGLCLLAMLWLPCLVEAQQVPPAAPAVHADEISLGSRLDPAALAGALQKNEAPLVLMVGPRTMYDQAHILKAEYAGPANNEAGLQVLRARVAHLEKDHWIVLYCGCCPWDRCPNVRPAFAELQRLGFSHVQVLFLTQNFGADWVNKGLPTEQ